jgi:hypothetical protein
VATKVIIVAFRDLLVAVVAHGRGARRAPNLVAMTRLLRETNVTAWALAKVGLRRDFPDVAIAGIWWRLIL